MNKNNLAFLCSVNFAALLIILPFSNQSAASDSGKNEQCNDVQTDCPKRHDGMFNAEARDDHALRDAKEDEIEIGSKQTDQNAVTQADDAFGFSVGKETIGLYSSSNVRGFSPIVAGNVRVNGLYFDQVFGLTNRVRKSSSIRIGVSAQGIPFPSPTGIVDYRLYQPGIDNSTTALFRVDSYGSVSIEADTDFSLLRDSLGVRLGAYLSTDETQDGTNNLRKIGGIMFRWRPTPSTELIPFWTVSEIADDQRGPTYVPGGAYLPPKVPRRVFNGPNWAEFNSIGISQGLIASYSRSRDLKLQIGAFRSELDDKTDFGHLMTNIDPDGNAQRLIIADPRSRFVSTSGEFRATKRIDSGPAIHVLHASFRSRNRSQRYGGSDVLNYGAAELGMPFQEQEPDFEFGQQTTDQVRQFTGGIAYEGQLAKTGSITLGVSKTDYRKQVELPDSQVATTSSKPWLFYGTAASQVLNRITLYASYTRGLEESGIAPDNAANRNEPMPAVITTQSEIGIQLTLSKSLKLIAGFFNIKKPYYNLNEDRVYSLLGDIQNQGIEVSLSGSPWRAVTLVAGAVVLRPRVTGEDVELGRVGARPVGLPDRTLMLNVDWKIARPQNLSIDMSATYESETISTRDNLVAIPGRTLVDLGGRYKFSIGGRDATLRFQVTNLTNEYGFSLKGAGAYDIIAGRVASIYLTTEF